MVYSVEDGLEDVLSVISDIEDEDNVPLTVIELEKATVGTEVYFFCG